MSWVRLWGLTSITRLSWNFVESGKSQTPIIPPQNLPERATRGKTRPLIAIESCHGSSPRLSSTIRRLVLQYFGQRLALFVGQPSGQLFNVVRHALRHFQAHFLDLFCLPVIGGFVERLGG